MQNGIDKELELVKINRRRLNRGYSREIFTEDAEVGIITNDFHMFLVFCIAQNRGSDVYGIAAEDLTKFHLPNNMLWNILRDQADPQWGSKIDNCETL